MASSPPKAVLAAPLAAPLAAALSTPDQLVRKDPAGTLRSFFRFTSEDPFALELAGFGITELAPVAEVSRAALLSTGSSTGLQVSWRYLQALLGAGAQGRVTAAPAVDGELLAKLQRQLKAAEPSAFAKAASSWMKGVATDGFSEPVKFGLALLEEAFDKYEGEVKQVPAAQLLAILRERDQLQLYERASDLGDYTLLTRELRLYVKSGEMEWLYLLVQQRYKGDRAKVG